LFIRFLRPLLRWMVVVSLIAALAPEPPLPRIQVRR
jgi:hypothetical protein